MYSSKSGSGRRRWTAKQRQRFLARFHHSQLTQRDFAGRLGIGLSTLSTRLPAAKITQIKEFTPAAWAEAKTMKKVVAQAA